MTDSLKDILDKRQYKQPDEIVYIKNFVQKKFGEEPKVRISSQTIIINVSNAPLAGALRMHLHHLAKDLKTDKKLLLRIG